MKGTLFTLFLTLFTGAWNVYGGTPPPTNDSQNPSPLLRHHCARLLDLERPPSPSDFALLIGLAAGGGKELAAWDLSTEEEQQAFLLAMVLLNENLSDPRVSFYFPFALKAFSYVSRMAITKWQPPFQGLEIGHKSKQNLLEVHTEFLEAYTQYTAEQGFLENLDSMIYLFHLLISPNEIGGLVGQWEVTPHILNDPLRVKQLTSRRRWQLTKLKNLVGDGDKVLEILMGLSAQDQTLFHRFLEKALSRHRLEGSDYEYFFSLHDRIIGRLKAENTDIWQQ